MFAQWLWYRSTPFAGKWPAVHKGGNIHVRRIRRTYTYLSGSNGGCNLGFEMVYRFCPFAVGLVDFCSFINTGR